MSNHDQDTPDTDSSEVHHVDVPRGSIDAHDGTKLTLTLLPDSVLVELGPMVPNSVFVELGLSPLVSFDRASLVRLCHWYLEQAESEDEEPDGEEVDEDDDEAADEEAADDEEADDEEADGDDEGADDEAPADDEAKRWSRRWPLQRFQPKQIVTIGRAGDRHVILSIAGSDAKVHLLRTDGRRHRGRKPFNVPLARLWHAAKRAKRRIPRSRKRR